VIAVLSVIAALSVPSVLLRALGTLHLTKYFF
jgi:hypothetical protein